MVSDVLMMPDRPKAATFLVEDLLKEAQSGRLRVPRFQRGLQWRSNHVRDLFDSIARGFPVGSILLWVKDAPSEVMTFGSVSLQVRAQQAYYIVDGQQRITALVGALLHPDDRPLHGVHAVWVDLDTMEFLSGRKRKKTDSCIPLNVLGQRTVLLHWARDQRDEQLVERAFDISERILRYSIPAYVVSEADDQTLRLIFGRMNSTGVSLSEKDVFQALFGEDGEPKPIDAMAMSLAVETQFGDLAPHWLLRCIKTVGGLPPHADYSERNPPPPDAVQDTYAALRRVITFFRSDAGIHHAKLLAYRFPLIVLALFFHKHPNPAPRNRSLLARWVWRGALSGKHGKSTNNNIARHEKMIVENEDTAVQNMLGTLPRMVETLPEITSHWSGNAAASALYANAMFYLNPLDEDGAWIQVEDLQDSLTRKKMGEVYIPWLPDPLGRTVAGRLLWLTRLPDDLLSLPERVLDSHGIDVHVRAALVEERYEEAARLRGELIKDALRALLDRYAPGEDRDRPPIQAILAGIDRT